MTSRPLVPAERMADRFDRAYTLNFTSVARVRGHLDAARLQAALRCLERRHPLLRARIAREAASLSFVLGEAREIPLVVVEAGEDELVQRAGETLAHKLWDDAGPRAELTWLRHGEEHSSLLLTMHHVVSDGSSGIIAMRDLLAFALHSRLETVVPVPSPGQDAFFPASHAALKAAFLERMAQAGSPPPAPVLRVSSFHDTTLAARRPALRRFRLTLAESEAITRCARRDGATVHGALMAATCLALAQESGESALQRLAHPVDFRRYLRELEPGGTPIGDAVGYYVSAITTEHQVSGSESMAELAAAISRAVRAAKADKEPFLTAPVRGPLLVERTRALSDDEFRELAERKVFLNSCGISNLGPLERLGASAQVGDLTVEDLFFVMASSVMNQLGASAVSFGGRIALQFSCVEPLVSAAFLERLAERARTLLREYT